MSSEVVEYAEFMCCGEGLDCDCVQSLVVDAQHIFNPHGVGYVVHVRSFRKMRAANRSGCKIVRTGNDKAGFGPAAILLELWGASDDLPHAFGIGK